MFPSASVLNSENIFSDIDGNEILRIWPMIAQDPKSGVKQRAIAIENLGSKNELAAVAQIMGTIFKELDSSAYVKVGNSLKSTGHEIDNNQMTFAARIFLYTNKNHLPVDHITQIFSAANALIEVIDESEMHKTLFISYGGPDEESARQINKEIKSKGVRTWFFPDDARPGDKLHRMMHNGVNNHDRVLLICSENSLRRPGVLNEIERVLEREAKEGGTEILIPVTLDDYVYGDWAPERSDISDQVKSRVITKIISDRNQLESSIEKLVNVLKK